jgi:hypothetical protein
MTEETNTTKTPRHFFVNEAGDGTVFDRKGNVIVGTEGCSRYFLLGMLDVTEPQRLANEMEELRARLMADPYFNSVPSMQPAARKTALAFHAKDDLPEVRREVFHLLLRHELRFYAVVRDKSTLLQDIRRSRVKDRDFEYHPNFLYDVLIQKLFTGLLHKYEAYDICFSRRGRSDRNAALRLALENAQKYARGSKNRTAASPFTIAVRAMPERAELQAVDYFLWSLQRFYERREDRYLALLWPGYRSVCYVDGTRKTVAGIYYTQTKPLTRAAWEEAPGI